MWGMVVHPSTNANHITHSFPSFAGLTTATSVVACQGLQKHLQGQVCVLLDGVHVAGYLPAVGPHVLGQEAGGDPSSRLLNS